MHSSQPVQCASIIGIHKRMHTVIEAHCTGCELCIPVCPVDCISLEVETPGRSGWQAWSQAQAEAALQRYKLHAQHRDTAKREAEPAPAAEPQAADTRKRSIVEAALARARAAAEQRATKS